MSDEEFFGFLARCREEMAFKQEQFVRLAPPGSPYRYDIDAGAFRLGEKIWAAVVIGSYCPSRGTWLWGWANDGFAPAARERATRFRDRLHQITGFQVFLDEGAYANSQDAEDFTAMVLHVSNGLAFWRDRSEDLDVYLCLEETGSRDELPRSQG